MKPSTEKVGKYKSTPNIQDNQSKEEIVNKTTPSPMDLTNFLPWLCLQWLCPKLVTVKREILEPYLSKKDKSITTKLKSKSKAIVNKSQTSDLDDEVTPLGHQTDAIEDAVHIIIFCDIKDTVLEIGLYKQYYVPQKVIHAISCSLPFNTSITKFSFCHGQLTASLLHEIGKMLPNSNITDLNLSGNYLPEANYFTLFDHSSQLKCLYLSRCYLNDVACNELFTNLKSHSLMVLDLSMNNLTDKAAKVIGRILRFNRSLAHLNLSGNKITSEGAHAILSSLSEFPLTAQEIMDMKKKKILYIENKIAIYDRCLENASKEKQQNKRPMSGRSKTQVNSKNTPNIKSEKLTDVAERMVIDIIGEFNNAFNCNGTVTKNEHLYCRGNFALCSLNMSYNDLDYFSVKHILRILNYQNCCKRSGELGLLRIVIEGNPIPDNVPEYIQIDELLRLAVQTRIEPAKKLK